MMGTTSVSASKITIVDTAGADGSMPALLACLNRDGGGIFKGCPYDADAYSNLLPTRRR
jgi:hypothetical protein